MSHLKRILTQCQKKGQSMVVQGAKKGVQTYRGEKKVYPFLSHAPTAHTTLVTSGMKDQSRTSPTQKALFQAPADSTLTRS